MTWSGANMRCPRCNQYLPDRCTCNGPSIEQQRSTLKLGVETDLGVPGGTPLRSPTGRLNPFEPVEQVVTKHGIERRYRGVAIDVESRPIFGMGFAKLETLIIDHTPGLPTVVYFVPPPVGQYRLAGINGMYQIRTASGNARQRRRQVRVWRREGFTVTHHGSST